MKLKLQQGRAPSEDSGAAVSMPFSQLLVSLVILSIPWPADGSLPSFPHHHMVFSVCLYVSVFLPVALPLAHFSWLTANEGGAVPIRRHWSPQTSLVFLPLAHAPWPRLIMRVFPMGFLPERVQDVLISSFVFTVWRPRH